MLKLIGFITGGGWAPLLIAAALMFGAGIGAAYLVAVQPLSATLDARTVERDAYKEKVGDQAKEKRALAAVVDRQQASMDRMDAEARAIQSTQAGQVVQLAAERRAGQNRTDTILSTLRGPDVQITASVSSVVKPGFDPRILDGIAWLRCLQDARSRGDRPDACAGRFAVASTGPGAAGAVTGADRWAPAFDDQLWLLGLVYRFRDWGVSCYDDKRAIAESQAAAAGPKIGATP